MAFLALPLPTTNHHNTFLPDTISSAMRYYHTVTIYWFVFLPTYTYHIKKKKKKNVDLKYSVFKVWLSVDYFVIKLDGKIL